MTYEAKHEEIRTVAVVYENVRCDGCEKPFKYGFDSAATQWPNLNPNEGVLLRMQGNYPSFWDDYSGVFLLCEECIRRLWEQFPVIAKAMREWQEAGT